MRLVVTGREGQVARSLVERGQALNHEVVTVARPELDLAGDSATIAAVLKSAKPDIIVSAAAYTAVDKAESEPDHAFRINADAAGAVASAARELDVPLIHLSTDYVFDGSKESPYTEHDRPGPSGVYGASKLAGEQTILAAHDNAAILRTAWVYSPFGSNFVKTMLRLAAEREDVGVVSDQWGNPTSALDIADGVIAVAANLVSSEGPALRGVFHMTADGEASWAEFAEYIFAISDELGGPSAKVRQIGTADYPTPAQRPANSRLDCSKLAFAHGVRLPDWRASTRQVVERLIAATADQQKDQ